MTTLLLETVDAVKKVLGEIEASGKEGAEEYGALRQRLQAVCDGRDPEAAQGPASAPPVLSDAKTGGPEAAAASGSQAPAAERFSGFEIGPVVPEEPGVEEHAAADPSAGNAAAAKEAEPAEDPRTAADEEGGQGPRRSVAESNIRVEVGLLDELMNLVGELVLARN